MCGIKCRRCEVNHPGEIKKKLPLYLGVVGRLWTRVVNSEDLCACQAIVGNHKKMNRLLPWQNFNLENDAIHTHTYRH